MRCRQSITRVGHLSAIALWVLLALPLPTLAGIPEGTAWLATKQNANGSFGNTAASLATPVQSTTEVLRAYQSLGQPAYTPALGFLNSDTESNTEFLTRKILINATAGSDVTTLINTLVTHQNPDGGFGDDAGQSSSILDTAFALQALAVTGYHSSQQVAAAVGFLVNRQGVTGGWTEGDNAESVHLTALALQSLWYSRHTHIGVSAVLTRAQTFLLSKRDTAGLWGETFDSALSLIALVPYLPDLIPVTSSIASLRAGQSANGSWNDDPYTTALALRALVLADAPQPNPDYVTIRGRVIDAQTGSPLRGVTVALSGPVSPTLTTGSDGAFLFLSLPAGSYTVQVALASYGTLSTVTSGQLGQRLDLGTLSLTKSQGATTGTIKGVVTDAATGAPLAGVSINATGATSVLTDAAGRYQLNNVAPGLVTVSASLSGYATASGSANLVAGGIVIFSPALNAGTAQGATLSGTVTSGATGVPLSGVTISVSGAATASAITDSAGSYQISGLTAGAVTLTALLTGYDTVTTGAVISSIGTVRFLPKLYPSGTTPPNTNTSGVTGLVLDAGSNAPLPGATVTAVFGTSTQTIASDASGRFTVTGLTAPQGTLHVAVAGHVSVDLGIALDPLTVLDIGQVRLRKTQASVLLPDLTVTAVDRTAAITDPRTLMLSGTVGATLSNVGTSNAPANVQVLAFHDANNNRVFDQGDTALGQVAMTSGLVVDATATISIPVQGALPFRDAPILVWVDSSQTLAELSEINNVGSTQRACQRLPDIGTFQPVTKWSRSIGTVDHAPIVGPLLDTNSDGKVDRSDMPTVVVIAGNHVTALSGKDGHVLWTSNVNVAGAGVTPALGDIDADGKPEIVTYAMDRTIVAVNNDGTTKWKSTASAGVGVLIDNTALTIADLDGDGQAEVLAGNLVLNSDGSLKWAGNTSGVTQSIPIVADLDMDGSPEVIMGRSVYHADGSLYWSIPINLYSFRNWAAVAKFDNDPYPSVLIVGSLNVYLFGHNGILKWGPVYLSNAYNGGPPTIADVDGDGRPDIGVAGADYYRVFNSDGSLKWLAPGLDQSGVTGSTMFDFDGDGQNEVLFANESELRVFNGKDGSVVFRTPNVSATWIEYPVVADVDNDQRADIVLASSNGVRAFQDVNNSWMNTRGIWNQHAYHITNVNDDGSIPKIEQNSWLTHNTYRLNTFPDRSANGQPDLTASLLTLLDNGSGALPSLTLRVGNAGAAPSPDGVQVTVYQGDPAAGGVAIGSINLASLAAGAYRDLRLENVTLVNSADLYVLVDTANAVTECDENNNTDRIPAVAINLLGTVTVATDAASYGPTTPVAITATVTNTGLFTASYQLDLRIEDPSGTLVAQLPVQGVGPLASNATTPVVTAWNTGTTLAGNYQVHARLFSANGALLSEALSPFAIGTPSGSPGAVTLRVLTDRPVYHTTDTVHIASLIANPTTNVLLDAVALKISILDPNNQVTFTHTGPIGQLPPGGLRDLLLPVSLNGAALAVYKVTGDILDSSQAVLAHAETSYTVRFDLAKSLAGKVVVELPVLEIGTNQSCTDTLTNLGSITVAGLRVHHALVNIDTQQLLGDSPVLVDLLPGATDTRAISIPTNNLNAGNYACVLRAEIDGNLTTLAFAPFKLTAPPIRIDAELKMGAKGRLLVLLDSPKACSKDDERKDDDKTTASNSGHDECKVVDNDPYGPSSAPALSAQRAFLETLLKAAGWSYTITDTADDFTRAFHSGTYTVYALFAEREKLAETTQKELREAVFRGEGLLLGGAHDNRNGRLDDALGVRLIGRVASAVGVMLAQDPLGLPGSFNLLPADPAVRIKRTSAQSLGTYVLGSPTQPPVGTEPDCREMSDGTQMGRADSSTSANSGGDDSHHDDCDGHPQNYLDAATLNAFGQGVAAFTGFDLLASAAQAGDGSLPSELIKKLLTRVHPATIRLVPGAGVPIDLAVTNRGVGTTAKLTLTLPTGVTVLDPGVGSVTTALPNQPGFVTWQLNLGVQTTETLHLWLRLPDAAGPVTLNAKVEVIKNGVATLYAQPSMTLTVVSAQTLDQLLAQAQSLHGSYPQDGIRLNTAERHLQNANRTASLTQTIGQLLAATDDLAGSTNPAIHDLRGMIDVWLRQAARSAYFR